MNLFKMRGGGALFLLMVIALIFTFGACDWGKDYDPGFISGVDFTNYITDRAISVRNLTNQRLVLFRNDLYETNILGGVDPFAGGEGWGISKSKNAEAFAQTGEFSIIVLTLDQYLENKGNLQSQKEKPFTRLYAYYNASGDNAVLYEISDKLGGSWVLRIENTSNYNIELRSGGVSGPTLGYAQAGMAFVNLYLNSGDFDIFPVLKRYNKARDILEIIYPKDEDNSPWKTSYVFNQENPQRVFNMQELINEMKPPTSGVAYLLISNSASQDVRLYAGNTIVYDWQGTSLIANSGRGKEFTILMDAIGNSNFQPSKNISNYRIGVTGTNVPIGPVGHTLGRYDNGPQLQLQADKIYTVNVTGSATQMQTNPLRAEIDLDNPTDFDFEDFNFAN